MAKVPKGKGKVLLIAPPRLYWPYISEGDNFLLPQSLPYLASALRQRGIEVSVIDCMPMKIGYKTLSRIISQSRPDVVAAGESHAIFADEVLKLFRIAKQVHPHVVTVAGGGHFSNLASELCGDPCVDFIAIGEGEETLPELVEAILGNEGSPEHVRGIAFSRDGKVNLTEPRALVSELDRLPFPAYDLMPMDLYSKSRFLFSPGGTTIHHSRGCVHKCKFCVWWVHMAERTVSGGKAELAPRWRTMSVGRTMEEIKYLHKKHGKRCFVFVDDTWNLNPAWGNSFADALLRENLDINWFAFMRADYIIRDEQLGIFEKLVRSGLSHVSIGVERADAEELNALGKRDCYPETTLRCFNLLKTRYPSVFRQATFIVGIPSETRESLKGLLRFARRLEPDYPAFHPLTPFPGTIAYREAVENGLLEVKDFQQFDLMTPVMSSKALSRYEIELLTVKLNSKFPTVGWLVKGLGSKSSYKRNLYAWWGLVTLRVALDSVVRSLAPFSSGKFFRLVKPKWYDS